MKKYLVIMIALAILASSGITYAAALGGIGGTSHTMNGQISLTPDSYGDDQFTIPSGATGSVSGTFTASGASGSDIIVYIMNSTNYANFETGRSFSYYYYSGQVTTGSFSASGLTSGTYYIVYSNTFSTVASKWITTQYSCSNCSYGPPKNAQENVQLTAANLGAGVATVASTTHSCSGANLNMTLNYPVAPTDATYLTGISLSTYNATAPPYYENPVVTNSTQLFYTSGNTCNSFSLAAGTVGGYGLIGGGTISLTIYFGTSLVNETTYGYSIALANGQYILGNSVAQ